MPRDNRPLLLRLLIAVVLVGICFTSSCGPTSDSTSPITSNTAAEFDVSTLDFETPELKERFLSFDLVARGAATGTGWKHREYNEAGSFASAVWALGDGYDDDCRLSRKPEHQVGTRKIEVDTVIVAGKAKSAGLTLELVDASPQEWSVFCNYHEATEQSVTGAGWGVTLFKWDPEKLATTIPFRPYEQTIAKLDLGPRYTYKVQHTPIDVVADLSQEEDILRYLISAESLRDTYLDRSGQLLKKVEETITAHQAERQIFGKYNGDGKLPATKVSKLTADEEIDELAKAREFFGRQQKLVMDNHVAMHAVLRKVFPFEKCWPELGLTVTK